MRLMGSLLLATVLAAISSGPTPAHARAPKPAKPTNVTGTVKTVNAPAKSFVLHVRKGWGKKAQEQDLTVLTTGGTTFKRAGKLVVTRKPAAFADLAANETVQVKGLPVRDGKVGATEILIKSGPKK